MDEVMKTKEGPMEVVDLFLHLLPSLLLKTWIKILWSLGEAGVSLLAAAGI